MVEGRIEEETGGGVGVDDAQGVDQEEVVGELMEVDF